MKNIVILVALLSTSLLSFAGAPPKAVQKAFKEKFPSAIEVNWTKENATEWEAEFSMDNTKVSANFKNDGSWVETETAIATTELPATVTTAIRKQSKGWTIITAFKIETANKGTMYEAEMKAGSKKKEVIYKEDGTPVK